MLKVLYYPIVWVGKVHLPRRRVKAKHYYQLMKVIRPGDALLSKRRWELTNLVIPGEWTHAALYVGNILGVPTVIEAVGSGVRASPLVQFMLGKDKMLCRSPVFASVDEKWAACRHAEYFIGRKYDYSLRSNNKALYCSELVWYAYFLGMGDSPFVRKMVMGVPTVSPDDIANANKKFRTVYEV